MDFKVYSFATPPIFSKATLTGRLPRSFRRKHRANNHGGRVASEPADRRVFKDGSRRTQTD